jgi:glutamine amidotransferase
MIDEPEKQTKAVIIDYGSGNLKSVFNAFKLASYGDVSVTHDFCDLSLSSHIILPGVGSFADCMKGLVSLPGMIETLQDEVIKNKKPFLGICVGMQLMASLGKENGTTKGLDWICGEVEKIIPKDPMLKIPHMGWNTVNFNNESHPIWKKFTSGCHAYFVHSYQFIPTNKDVILATTEYGENITAVVGSDNIIGTQFHPEKSQSFGQSFIKEFLMWDGNT